MATNLRPYADWVPTELTPETLRALLREFEPLRGTAIATGDLRDGTDASVSVAVLLDDGYAHAAAWKASERRLEAAKRLAAEEAWRTEVVEPEMVSLTVCPGGEYANKQEWLDDWMASWQDEVERLAAALAQEAPHETP